MPAARYYERNDLYFAYMTPLSMFFLSVAFLLLSLPSFVTATPVQADADLSRSVFAKRDGSGGSNGSMSPKIWIPIIIAVIILFCISVMTWTRTSWRRVLRFFSFSGATIVGAPVSSSPAAPRELTAEQLAGTINGANQSGDAPRPTRRTRRPRRTPSQMSVTSLPPYNKEPGEEELVIFRGRDPEDVTTMPTAVAVTSLDEEQEDSDMSHDHSRPSQYSPMPASPHDAPLLQDDEANGDLSLQSLSSPGEDMHRHNSDNSSHETSSLRRVGSHVTGNSVDLRDEAPSYSEAVGQAESQQRLVNSPDSNASLPVHSSGPSEQRTNRRSGFRTLLNRMSMVGHSRNESTSTYASHVPQGRESSVSRASNHRATPSGSSQLLTSSVFRTISRQRSTHTLNSARLNSPSLISLNSISAPLTHTVTRTEFTYPRSGPTPEQLKVISSRESFARFGVPYGPDAIAFAASSSRQDLLPPPDFETVTFETSRRPASPGPSRLRSPSNPAPRSGQSLPSEVSESQETHPTDTANRHSRTVSSSSLTGLSNPVERSSSAPNGVSETPSSASVGGNGTPSTDKPQFIANADDTTTTLFSDRSNRTVSEFGSLTVPPPSSYHDRTGSSTRSESRASVFSNQSYATAAESLTASTAARSATEAFFNMHGSENGSGPPTPRLSGKHALEPTDMTITPDRHTTTLPLAVEVGSSS
ncbi:hypothetical protein CVT26_009616 [Gymnopilus dilepis]|uniref:Uncharacterized protein n=1 Tax=Gymnopilus dilepis TaxID=231916 RepID=A0A409VKT0_9AGAR|nr:hypothetical protein CVT26_009616 [Gymnopilus dilepis]